MLITIKTFLSSLTTGILYCIPFKRRTTWMDPIETVDPLLLLGKSLEETTLDDFSEGWDKTKDENAIAGLLQLQHPQRHQLLLSNFYKNL